ncbi:MAG: hypothetical protein H0Z38_03240 [Firmicutes bacterium]|nr:hypothetical protein [Bacillota bacterium]
MRKILSFSIILILVFAIMVLPVAAHHEDSGSKRWNMISGEAFEYVEGVVTVNNVVGVASTVQDNVSVVINDLQNTNTIMPLIFDFSVLSGNGSAGELGCPGKVAFNRICGEAFQNAKGIITVQQSVGNFNTVQSNVSFIANVDLGCE